MQDEFAQSTQANRVLHIQPHSIDEHPSAKIQETNDGPLIDPS